MEDFAVIGLGRYGFNIARQLAEKGNKVLAIDINPEKVEKIKGMVAKAVVGDAKNKSLISELVNKYFLGVIISIGSNMVDSIVAVDHLKALNISRIIVKANNEIHAELLKFKGVTEIIFPERDIAESLTQRLTDLKLTAPQKITT